MTSVLADLRLQVDGLDASVVADGDRIGVRTAHAGRLLREATVATAGLPRRVSLRAVAGQVATVLDDAGLTARLVGTDGTIVTVGRGARSTLGRVVSGSEHLALGPPTAVVRALLGYGTLPSRGRVVLGSSVLTAVLVGGGLVHRLRSARTESTGR